MNMRKTLILFLLIFVLPAQSQIQRSILGYTLGKTTKTELINSLKLKGKQISKTKADDNAIIVKHMKFGGIMWPDVFFVFYNNKLCAVNFIETGESLSQENIDLHWSIIKNNLRYKYSFYLIKEIKEELEYNDNKTKIWTSCLYRKGYKCISLLYCDDYLIDLKRNKDLEDF